MREITKQLYDFVAVLPRFGFPVAIGDIPANGIYLFFEHGESVELDGTTRRRITRVGTHSRDGRLPGRLKQHYGRIHSLGGNKNASVFRRHVGGALLRRDNMCDPRIADWLRSRGKRPPDVEKQVSAWLRENFTFSCIPVGTATERKELESGLVSLLSQHPISEPSDQWLGRFAYSPVIRASGLWNVNETQNNPLSELQLEALTRNAMQLGRVHGAS